MLAVEELVLETGGGSAASGASGLRTNAVLKEGGHSFRGTSEAFLE